MKHDAIVREDFGESERGEHSHARICPVPAPSCKVGCVAFLGA